MVWYVHKPESAQEIRFSGIFAYKLIILSRPKDPSKDYLTKIKELKM